jgi:phage shock protein E
MKPFFYLVATFMLIVSNIALAQDPLWLDVRTPEEFATEHLAQAKNVPHQLVGEKISEYTTDKDAAIYLYCRSGTRASIALSVLEEMGYTQVVNLGSLESARAFAEAAD